MGPDPVQRFGRFEIDPARRALLIDGASTAIGARAFDLLLALVDRRERVVTKQELMDLVWPGIVVEEHNIAAQMSTLRKLLGPDVIATVAGRGYRFIATPEPAQRADVPPARHNLPQPRTRFIGRESALDDLARLVPQSRLLTLTGIGGCGKTSLALQFARRQLAAFTDGVWFVDLVPLQDATRVVASCAAVAGLREASDSSLIERLVAHLQGRRTLLVLDNCEHVIDGVIALVDALLVGTGGTTILATSREALGVAGEQIYAVRSLSLPATDDLQTVREAESVRVFVDRARLLQPDFDVNADNAGSIADICRRLDGIALAIELAAARVTMLSVAQIAARLDDRFRLLTGGSRTLPRHQTLQAAIQWSYEQLTPAQQRMLQQVAVCTGGWTLKAAGDIAGTTDEYEALELLTALHDKSLLAVDRDGAGGQPRYRMLETVRQYALDRLHESGEGEAAKRRHAAHYIAMAEAAAPHVRGSAQDAWMSLFKQEHENLVAAMTWCCEGAVDPQWGLRLAAACAYYWGWNSVELGHRLALAALHHDHVAATTRARTDTLRALARLSLFRGRDEDALSFAQQALTEARQLGAPQPLAWALSSVAMALETLGRSELALQTNEEALELARQLGDGMLMFTVLVSIAASSHRRGELAVAERCYREALTLGQEHCGRVGLVIAIDNLVRLLVAQGKLDEARQFALQSLSLAREEKVGVDVLEATVGLASRLGDHAVAARFWGAADRQLLAWGYRHEPGELEHITPLLAESRRQLGDAAYEAAEAAGRALEFNVAMLELEKWLQSSS